MIKNTVSIQATLPAEGLLLIYEMNNAARFP